jgi:hypothetical protein
VKEIELLLNYAPDQRMPRDGALAGDRDRVIAAESRTVDLGCRLEGCAVAFIAEAADGAV